MVDEILPKEVTLLPLLTPQGEFELSGAGVRRVRRDT